MSDQARAIAQRRETAAESRGRGSSKSRSQAAAEPAEISRSFIPICALSSRRRIDRLIACLRSIANL